MSYSKPEGLYFYLASDMDTKYLHAEVYHSAFFICQINTEQGDFGMSFFNDPRINPGQEAISVNLQDFMTTLERAKEELKKFPNGLA